MTKPLIEDGLWAVIEPLLPKRRRRERNPGQQRCNVQVSSRTRERWLEQQLGDSG
jgi:transposase